MKLSQAILISFSILICFSPITALEMEQVAIDVNDRNDHGYNLLPDENFKPFINYNDYQANRIKLDKQHRIINLIKAYYINFFTSIFFICWVCNGSKNFNINGIMESTLFGFILILPFFSYLRMLFSVELNKRIEMHDADNSIFWLILLSLANVNGSLCDKDKSLVLAAQYNRIKFAKLILKKIECIPEIKDIDGYNSLDYALFNKNFEIVKLLLENKRHKKFDLDVAVTYAIIKRLSLQIIKLLFDKGGKFISCQLDQAIEKADFQQIKFLIDHDINVNMKDENGTPVIFTAVHNKKLEIIDLMMAKGADAGIDDVNGKTVIDYLYTNPQIENANLILSKFINFRKKLANQIYKDLKDFNFAKVHADLIAEYLV